MSSWKWFLLSLFGGGIAFWIPDVVIPALDRNEQGVLVTFACPALLILFYVAVLRLRKAERSGPSTAIFAVCGMWLLALSFTLLAQEVRAHGGGTRWALSAMLMFGSFCQCEFLNFWRRTGGCSRVGCGIFTWST